jgi:hypothetical protein
VSRARTAGASTVLLPVVTLLLSACTSEGASVSLEVPACSVGDDERAANGVVLTAQSVPTASWIPCVDSLPLGWDFAGLDARSGSTRFWLDSDRDGHHAIEVRLDRTCDTEGATPVPTDREGLSRLERVSQVTPEYHGRRFYLFDGGCITVVLTLAGEYRGEPLALVSQGIGVVAREALAAQVHEETGGRLELDPPADDEEGTP